MKRLIIAVAACIVLAAAIIVASGLSDHVEKADVIIVPGNTVNPDGTPSHRLKARLDAALLLYRTGYAPLIFVSGGKGKEGFDEAVAMSSYLQRYGVPNTSVIVDSAGITTQATAINAAQYMQQHGLKSALVATQYFHVMRTKLALERQGVKVAGSIHAQYFELRDLYSTLREIPACVAYYVKS